MDRQDINYKIKEVIQQLELDKVLRKLIYEVYNQGFEDGGEAAEEDEAERRMHGK